MTEHPASTHFCDLRNLGAAGMSVPAVLVFFGPEVESWSHVFFTVLSCNSTSAQFHRQMHKIVSLVFFSLFFFFFFLLFLAAGERFERHCVFATRCFLVHRHDGFFQPTRWKASPLLLRGPPCILYLAGTAPRKVRMAYSKSPTPTLTLERLTSIERWAFLSLRGNIWHHV